MPRQRLAPGVTAPVYINETGRAQRLAAAPFVNESATTQLAADGPGRIAWTSALADDRAVALAIAASLAADAAWRGEAGAGETSLLVAPMTAASALALDSFAASDARSARVRDTAAPAEVASGAAGDTDAPAQSLAGMSGQAASPADLPGSLARDSLQPLDWAGALVIVADVIAPLAFAAQLALERSVRLASAGALAGHVAGPLELAAASRRDHAVAVDLGGVTGAQLASALDHVAGLAGAAAAPIAWSASILGETETPATFGADLGALAQAALDWLASRPLRRVLLIFRAPS